MLILDNLKKLHYITLSQNRLKINYKFVKFSSLFIEVKE